MNDNLILGLRGNGSLGDALWLTPPMKVLRNVVVQMHNDKQCHEVSTIYESLATVEFTDMPVETIYRANNEDKTHPTQKVLNVLGITEVNCIPKIQLKLKEINWAKDFLKEYKNPIAIKNENSGINSPSNYRAQYLRAYPESLQYIVNYLISLGYTPLQFGQNTSFSPLKNTIHIKGLSIRQLAACYFIIGKYIGCDTGDYHLMLSVGGKCYVSIPHQSVQYGYLYYDSLYKPQHFKNEDVRVRYALHEKFHLISKNITLENFL
jgi:hypothetical protein